MEHKGTKPLYTARLHLRPFVAEDVPLVFQNWTNSEEVSRFLTWLPHKSLDVTEQVLRSWISNYSRKNFYQWAIVLKEINQPIGSIAVVDMDEKTNRVHIGYCIGKAWWGKGLASEAFSTIIPFLFEKVKANRIDAKHDIKNPASGKVMEKCGLQFEARLRSYDWNRRGIVDVDLYALLAEDYFQKRKNTKPMQILKVTSKNLHEAAEIYTLSWRESHRELCSPAFLESKTLTVQKEYLRTQMDIGKNFYMLVDGFPRAIVSEYQNTIEHLYVHPNSQGQGYGSRLLDYIMMLCKGSPNLSILNTNRCAHAFYTKRGFVETGQRKYHRADLYELEMCYTGVTQAKKEQP